MKRGLERLMVIAWPSFLMAGVLEMIVFAFVDPALLTGFGGGALDWPPSAVYTVAFLVFWAVIAAASFMTELLDTPPAEINSRSFR